MLRIQQPRNLPPNQVMRKVVIGSRPIPDCRVQSHPIPKSLHVLALIYPPLTNLLLEKPQQMKDLVKGNYPDPHRVLVIGRRAKRGRENPRKGRRKNQKAETARVALLRMTRRKYWIILLFSITLFLIYSMAI